MVYEEVPVWKRNTTTKIIDMCPVLYVGKYYLFHDGVN